MLFKCQYKFCIIKIAEKDKYTFVSIIQPTGDYIGFLLLSKKNNNLLPTGYYTYIGSRLT